MLPSLPVVNDFTVLDPALLERPVQLRVAPVEHVVLLAGRADDPGEITGTPLDGGAVLEALLTDAVPLPETQARMVSARGHRLTSGPPAAMVEALRGAIS